MKIKKLTAVMLTGALLASLTLTGCGKTEIDPDAVVATLGDKEISLGLANFMAQYNAVTYDAYYSSYFGADMWTQDFSGDGSTLEDSVKDQILDQLETGYLLEQHMADYGVEISDDEMTAMSGAAAQFMSDNSAAAIKQMTATEENVAEMLRLDTIQQKMRTAIIADVDTEVSDEEAAQRTFSYYSITLPDSGTEDADGTEAVTEESTEQQAEELQTLADQVAADAATDFDGVADKYGYTASTYSYGSDETGFDTTVLAEADSLTEGQVSGVIKTDSDAYYVIRLDSEFDEEATQNKKDEIVSQRQDDKYTEVCDGYKEDADWTVNDDVWATVTFVGNTYTVSTNDTEEASTESVTDTTEAALTEGTETAVDTEALESTEQ